MKFLWEFISCYGAGHQQPAAFEHTADVTSSTHAVPASKRLAVKKKKKKQSSSGNWKPALSVIIENSVVLTDANISHHTTKSSLSKSTPTFSSFCRDEFRYMFSHQLLFFYFYILFLLSFKIFFKRFL